MPTHAQAAAGNLGAALLAVGAAGVVAADGVVRLAVLMLVLAAANLLLGGLWLWLEASS